MKQYKFKVGDSFILPPDPNMPNLMSNEPLFGSYNYVVGVSKEQLVTLSLVINSKGIVGNDFKFNQFDLTLKTTITQLSTINNAFPETKFAQVGSKVVYDEDEFLLMGLRNVNFGTMSFIKPLLINADKMMDVIEDSFSLANSIDDVKAAFDLNLTRFQKIPLESNKTLEIFEVAPPKFPATTITEIKIEAEEETSPSSLLIPPLSNTFTGNSDKRVWANPKIILQGLSLPYDTEDLIKGRLPFAILGKGQGYYGSYAKIIDRTIFGNVKTRGNGALNYTMQEGESIFPNWKLTTDSQFSSGQLLTEPKNFNFNTTVMLKFLEVSTWSPNQSSQYLFRTPFGLYDIGSNIKNSFYVNHPEMYLGGNKTFPKEDNDTFLLLGKQPLEGTKKDGLDSVWYKDFGSTQFPVKTRKQLKLYSKYDKESQVEDVLKEYQNDVFRDPQAFFPKRFFEAIQLKRPDQIANVTEFYKSFTSPDYSWQAYNLLSTNQASLNQNKSEIENKILEYFDYENLAVIMEKNPKLYNSITELMGNVVETYLKNLPNKKSSFGTTEVKEFLLLEFDTVYWDYRTETDRQNFSLRYDTLNSAYENLSAPQGVENIYKGFISTVKSITNNSIYVEYRKAYATKEQFQDLIIDVVRAYKGSCMYVDMEQVTDFDFKPNISIYNYFTNFVAGISLDDQFNRYRNEFFPRFNFDDRQRDEYDINISRSIYFIQYDFDQIVIKFYLEDNTYNQNKNFIKQEIKKIHLAYCDAFLALKRLYYLIQFMDVFKYYTLVNNKMGNKVDITYEDINNDIRFIYYLRIANIIGHFSDEEYKVIENLFETIKNSSIALKGKIQFINVDMKMLSSLNSVKDIIDWKELREKAKEEGIILKDDKYWSIQKLLVVEPKRGIEYIKSVTDLMKENSSFKDLLEGNKTASDLWLGKFGVYAQVVEEEEEVVEIESEGEPKVTVEEVEDVNLDDIDWDEIDPDDIDIALSDEDFLEDNIEI